MHHSQSGGQGINATKFLSKYEKKSCCKMYLKMSPAKCWPFCSSFDVLNQAPDYHLLRSLREFVYKRRPSIRRTAYKLLLLPLWKYCSATYIDKIRFRYWLKFHSDLKYTVALKGHHSINFSLHYINFDLCEKKILRDYVYIIILHVYIIILHVCINNLHVYIIILHVYIIIYTCIHNYLACIHKYLACIHD